MFGKKPSVKIPTAGPRPGTSLPEDMRWLAGIDRWAIHFRYNDEDFYFHPGGLQDDQEQVDDICRALRTNAYRSKGFPPPPFPLSNVDPMTYDCAESHFYIVWEYQSGWHLALYAVQDHEDSAKLFQFCPEPDGGWDDGKFDHALQALYATIDQARSLGWR